ncbi:hypothetical protein EJ02DRAFT_431322 [Clathrospora elynae]|uniref:Uncharacterized protein n=1 Tax=Clathrospora elynae TaxID=706981 RepID=A0A6A5T4Y9_9PLEO|nr:hypothetical protein EJ02DRAFT_431322 [Clathrospora elynae]
MYTMPVDEMLFFFRRAWPIRTDDGNIRMSVELMPQAKQTFREVLWASQLNHALVPPLYDLLGNGVTALVPQPIPGETELCMIIADGKDNPFPFVGQLQSSGRKYTCDEFPPASWIEGGVGLGGDGLPGTTYCTPLAFKCDDDTNARGSEQNWQGFVHSFLGAHLEARLGVDGATWDVNNPIAFRFHYEDQVPDVQWAARIAMDRESETDTRKEVNPDTPFQRRSKMNATRSVIWIKHTVP